MDRVIYTSMTAASQSLVKQSVISNNLANVSTPGFRSQLAVMKAVPVEGDSMQTRIMVTATTPSFDSSLGSLDYTGRDLDVALAENHWLAIKMPDGSEAYTRNGAIQVDETGRLTVQGHPLLGNEGELTVPVNSKLTISSDGTISALGVGDNPTDIVETGKIKRVFIGRVDIERGEDGFFHLTEQAKTQQGNTLPDNPNTKLMSGVLEGSNVNAVSAMVDLISNSRQFEIQMKGITTADEDAQKANQILSLS